MIVDCLLAVPGGNLPLGPFERALPFKNAPEVDHPFLSLGDYFDILETSLSEDRFSNLTRALSVRLNRAVPPEEISRLTIRSEKHGALYHVSVIEILLQGEPVLKFALNTAFSESARTQAALEFEAIKTLSETFDYPYLPTVRFFRERTREVRGKKVPVAQFLCDWLEDFYEWHLVKGEEGRPRACIWDSLRGRRFTDESETGEIFRHAARILTLYYDPKSSRRIHPVRHAAGDFVVKTSPHGLEVRLTTARDYAPLFEGAAEAAPQMGLFYFFLDLTLRMRLDREEGVGDPLWAGAPLLEATVLGFLEALAIKGREGRIGGDETPGFRTLLRSFSPREFEEAYGPLLLGYRLTDPAAEFSLIERHLRIHTEELCRVIQGLR
jgi:hypothetical protein